MKSQDIALHALALFVWLLFNDFWVSWSIIVKAFRALSTYHLTFFLQFCSPLSRSSIIPSFAVL